MFSLHSITPGEGIGLENGSKIYYLLYTSVEKSCLFYLLRGLRLFFSIVSLSFSLKSITDGPSTPD